MNLPKPGAVRVEFLLVFLLNAYGDASRTARWNASSGFIPLGLLKECVLSGCSNLRLERLLEPVLGALWLA